jgi:hypothetical protein
LGCPATDYTSTAFYNWASYNSNSDGADTANQIETDPRAKTFKKNPAFIWYGPGALSAFSVSAYAGGNLFWGWRGEDFNAGSTGSNWWQKAFKGRNGYGRGRIPLFTCPQVYVNTNSTGLKILEPPHRPEWGNVQNTYVTALFTNGDSGGTTGVHRSSFAGNVGFSDGAVRFREAQIPVGWDPITWRMATKDF